MFESILAVIGGLILLTVGADKFVHGAASAAQNLGISTLVIGLTVVGIATSAPEMFISCIAAYEGKTSIAIGNAIGSNIANIGLVLGATALIRPLLIKSHTLKFEYWLMWAAMILPWALLLDGNLNKFDAIALLAAFVSAALVITWLAKRTSRADPLVDEIEQERPEALSNLRSGLLAAAGLVAILIGAELTVFGAVQIAKIYNISDLVIGLTIVAVGTSLPELATSLACVFKKEYDLAIGNIIGSNIFNMSIVLGLAGLIQPADVNSEVLARDFPLMGLLAILMGIAVFIRNQGQFTRFEGGILLTGFIAYQGLLLFPAVGLI